jgi:hypothetical protein
LGNRLEPAEKSQVVYQNTILITSDLIEAFLSCPYKCYLLSRGKTSTGSDYTNWVIAKTESYQNNGVLKITAEHPHGFVNGSIELSNWKNASWLFALDQTVQTQDWESKLQVVQRLQSEPTISSAQLVPIRFVFRNKLSNTDKMLATFDALVLSKSFGIKVGIAKIVHGEKCSISRVCLGSYQHEGSGIYSCRESRG